MIKQFKGTGVLANRVDRLPVRARVGTTLLAARVALDRLRISPNFPIAAAAFELVRRWYEGQRFDPDRFEETLAHEDHKGVVTCEIEAQSEPDKAAWLILEDALLYTAFHAYREIDAHPSPAVSEVDEHLFDELENHLQALSPTAIETAFKGIEYLARNQQAAFAQMIAQ